MVILKLTCATCHQVQRLSRDDFVHRITQVPDSPNTDYDRILTFRCDDCLIPNDEKSIDEVITRWN
jgi:hypothetical protein